MLAGINSALLMLSGARSMLVSATRERYEGGEFEQPQMLEGLFGDIEAANELISAGELDDKDIEDLITEFNNRWPYIAEEVLFLGKIYTPEFKDGISRYEDITSDDLNEFVAVELTSGFVPGGVNTVSVGFGIVGEGCGRQIGHVFHVGSFSKSSSSFQKFESYLYGFAYVDEVEVIPTRRSQKEIEARARHYYPGLIEDIDVAVYNKDSFSDALKSLSGIGVSVQEVDRRELENVIRYLNRVLEIETRTPYLIHLDENNPSDTVLCHIYSFSFVVVERSQGGEYFEIAIVIDELAKDTKEARQTAITLEVISSIVDLRRLLGTRALGMKVD